jgi:membrane protein DedA with SNARE-associated domain
VFLLALDLTAQFNELVDRFNYLGPFVVLLLCGVGLPLPEEVTLIASGLLLYQGKVDFVLISAVCAAAILLGDTIPYVIGRRYGLKALQNRFASKLLHPERFAIVENKFKIHGSWVVFMCRFLPGIRIPAYFTAGTLRMGYLRFLMLDGLGVLISVPTSIYIAMLFGGQVERIEEQMENFHLILAFVLVAVLGIVAFRMITRRRARQARELAALSQAGPEAVRATSPESVPEPDAATGGQPAPHTPAEGDETYKSRSGGPGGH